MMSNAIVTIYSGASIGGIIKQLGQFDPNMCLLLQVILPDGTPYNVPATIGEIPASNCGDGLPYLYMQMRCDNLDVDRGLTEYIKTE